MMKTTQQILKSLIDEGFETSRDYPGLNLGTKVLYLERAISQDCQTFLQSLDKLYQPGLDGEVKAAHIKFIHALKVINNLCFNNQVKYGRFGTRAILTCYFFSLDDIVVGGFQTTVQKVITEKIKTLSEAEGDEVTAQKKARVIAEVDIVPEIGWRTELDLPLAQQADIVVIQALNGVLSEEQYRSLSAAVKEVIAGNIDSARRLVQEIGASFEQIQELAALELQQLFDHLHEVAQLTNQVHITLDDLLKLSQPIRTELLKHFYAVVQLVNEAHIPLADLVALDPLIRTKLFEHSYDVIPLVTKAIPLVNLVALDPPIRTVLLCHGYSVARLVKQGTHITLANLLALDQSILAKLLKHPGAVLQLVKKVPTLFADLLKLQQPILEKLIDHLRTVAWLVNNNTSFELLSHLSDLDLSTVLKAPGSEASLAILSQHVNNQGQDPVNDPNRANGQDNLNNLEQISVTDATNQKVIVEEPNTEILETPSSTHNNENEITSLSDRVAALLEIEIDIDNANTPYNESIKNICDKINDRIAELAPLYQPESANSQKQQINKEVKKLNKFFEKFETVTTKLKEFNSFSNNSESLTKQLTPANKEQLEKKFSEMREAISDLDDSLLSLPQRIVDAVVSFLGAAICFLGGVLVGALAGTKAGVILGAPTAIVSGPVGPAITASIGTAVGAGIGGAVGAVTGWKLGHKIATYGIFKTTDNVKRSFHEFAQSARSHVELKKERFIGNL
jgi:hypothetical protein